MGFRLGLVPHGPSPLKSFSKTIWAATPTWDNVGPPLYWMPQEEHLSCSCYLFEFSGILCRHALPVLSTVNCFQIPDQYLPIRWRRVNELPAKLIHITPNEHSERVHAFQSMVSTLISESAKSKERLDIATEQISTLLSRIREVPVSAQVMRDVIHRSN